MNSFMFYIVIYLIIKVFFFSIQFVSSHINMPFENSEVSVLSAKYFADFCASTYQDQDV